MSKHAYMIIAHNQFELLEKLILALDDERNDIFVHIDAKVSDFDSDHFKNIVSNSILYFTDGFYKIKWGSFDMVKAEYALIEKAFSTGEKYSFFHLLSGVDLPIKSNDEIHSFFDKNNDKEFVHFTHEELNSTEMDRVRAYHFFTGRRNYFNRIMTKAESKLARLLGINRTKGLAIQKGGQWFSITYDFAKYVLDNKAFCFKQFSHTFIPDEFFIQTLLVNSDFKDRLYHPIIDNSPLMNMHLADWERGNPYTFTLDDFDELMASPCMFARKFDIDKDSKIVDMILSEIKK